MALFTVIPLKKVPLNNSLQNATTDFTNNFMYRVNDKFKKTSVIFYGRCYMQLIFYSTTVFSYTKGTFLYNKIIVCSMAVQWVKLRPTHEGLFGLGNLTFKTAS